MTISQFPIPAGGIPTGDTAGRPASPVIGNVYYNGQLAILEIYDGTNWVPCSAPAASPTIAVADVGTSVAYGSAQGAVTITEGASGGPADSFIISASTGGYTATTSGTTVTITVGNNGSYTFSGQGINNFGTSVAGPSTSATLTTVPQAPTIGTATTSGANTDVTVTWTLGNNGGKNLSAITVTPFLDGTTAQTATTAATTASTSATIVGLTGGSSYTFKVKTTNANGTSVDSTATNSVTIPNLVIVNYLVVAGGGGGGGVNAGGGAGGLRSTVTATGGGGSLESALNLTGSTNYTVTVGAGGAGAPGIGDDAANGSNSVFSTITSTGGGAAGKYGAVAGTVGASGGSGGGGGFSDNAGQAASGGAGTANQGYAGGNGNGNSSGGGGGAGAVGGAGTSAGSIGGNGGAGVAVSITGSSVTYAGGGGAGTESTSPGTGGAGGGGNGADRADSIAATAGGTNTGGGGGGGSNLPQAGKSGGSGVVILKYPDSRTITIGAGLTGSTASPSGGFKVTTITAGSGNVSWA